MSFEDSTNHLSSLLKRGISRRIFLKFCTATAVAMGLDFSAGRRMASAAVANAGKKPVVWLTGQGCTGCAESLISSLNPDPATIVLDLLSIRYQPAIMAGAGDVAKGILEETVSKGGYILVLEGSIPLADPRYCMTEGKPIKELFIEAAKNADVVVAAGACASYGGIPAAGITGAAGAQVVVKDKPVINLPGCPVKPTWILGTVLYYLTFKEAPPLDDIKRPVAYFKRFLQHDSCPRRGHYDKGEFLVDWNDPNTNDWCLFHKGCKGPVTYADCPRIWWNDGVNYCIRAGSPCAGCTQPEFYAGFTPLYAREENIPHPALSDLSAASVAKGITAITAAGVVVHAVGRTVTGRKNQKEETEE